MSLEQFKSLMEVQSLDNKISEHLDKIKEHENRIDFIQKNRDKRENEKGSLEEKLASHLKEISSMEKDLFSLEKELERANSHLSQATTSAQVEALEKEIATLSPKSEQLEEDILLKMDSNEELESEIKKISNFLEGSSETIKEVKAEVEQDCEKENIEINRYQERIDALLETVSNEYKAPFLRLNEKYRFNSPLSFIVGGTCSSCRFQVTGVQKEQVEQGRSLEFCSGCGRILAPYGAKNL